VQARGALRKELTRCLRTGRAQRRPHRRTDRGGPLLDMVLLSERPAEVEDRAVPGHWEGDLIIGKGGCLAIGTLVERQSRYVMLLHLSEGRAAEHVRFALAEHARFSVDTGVQVYFCDPRSPGSAPAARTRTACCANTSRRAPIYPATTKSIWTGSLTSSTDALDKPSAG